MPDFHCYATLTVGDDGALPGVEVTDMHGFLVRRSEHTPGWAAAGDSFDLEVLDTELGSMGLRRITEWDFGAAYAHAIAEQAT